MWGIYVEIEDGVEEVLEMYDTEGQAMRALASGRFGAGAWVGPIEEYGEDDE